MKSLTLKAYAKINLHLDVVSKSDNGYHGVNTVMQSVSLSDNVRVSFCDGEGIFLSCNLPTLPCDERNLAYRAARLFLDKMGREQGVSIEIEKNIPMAAGLAGGSTDAAAVLYALNELFSHPLSSEELLSLGAKLGADVPFCIVGGTKFADGFGEKLHDFPNMPSCYIVVACAGEGVSTPWAYSELDRKYRNFEDGAYQPKNIDKLRLSLEKKDIADISASIFNLFEGVISAERPMVNEIRTALLENGALASMMSGSGPSVFGIFESEEFAVSAAKILADKNIPSFVCEPIGERF